MGRAMVGRDAPLADVLARIGDESTTLVLVSGDAGIGKSTLVSHVLDEVEGRLVLSGACLAMRRQVPLLPLVQALDPVDPDARTSLARAVTGVPPRLRSGLADLAPRLVALSSGPTSDDGSRDDVFLACGALLASASEQRPVLVVVEDVHWADEDTLDLLTYLTFTASTSGRLAVVATLRSDEAPLARHVTDWLDRARRDPRVHEVPLQALGRADVARLVDALDGDGVAVDVFERAQGNPFFTEQLVAAARTGVRLPARLADVLVRRVRSTSMPAQRVLAALAVVGQPLDRDGLELSTGLDEATCLAAVAELDDAHLVRRQDGLTFPRHALLAEAVLAGHPGLTRAEHRRAACTLEALGDDSTAGAAADHWRGAGEDERELAAARVAASRAWRLRSFAEAAQWYARVARLARRLEVPGEISEVEEVRRWMRSLDRSGDLLGATQVAEEALDRFVDWPDPDERFRVRSAAAHLVMVQDKQRGMALLEQMLAEHAAFPPTGSYAHALSRVGNAYLLTDSARALDHIERALATATALGDDLGRSHALARLAGVLLVRDDKPGCDRAAAEALAIGQALGDGDAILDALVMISDAHLKYAEYALSLEHAYLGLALADDLGQKGDFLALVLSVNAAEANLHLGRTEDAGAILDVLTRNPSRGADDRFLDSLRCLLRVRRGDLVGALDSMSGPPTVSDPVTESRRIDAEALAEALLWSGEAQSALVVCVAQLEAEADTDDSHRLGHLLSLAARAVADDPAQREQGPGLRALHAACRRDPFAARDTLPRGAVDRVTWQAELARARGHHDSATWLEAAEGWAALDMPHDAAYCRCRAAEALAATDDRDALRTVLRTAHAEADGHQPLRERLEELARGHRIQLGDGAPPPVAPGGLTAQEARVLALVAEGMTNKEIGATLFISAKTASVHVSNLMRKLGAANRAEAAAWAARNGVQPPS